MSLLQAPQLSEEQFSGLSGATVGLRRGGDNTWVVRKVASSPAASERLRIQAQKQASFSVQSESPIRTPRIVGEGELEGRYYFDMEYVRGLDGASFLRQATYTDVVSFADCISNYVDFAANAPAVCDSIAPGFFEALFERICKVQQRTSRIPTEVFGALSLSLDQLRRLNVCVPTFCHGDLTLANLIIDESGTVWAVDLLDSPFEHYWQDIAKIHQDLAGGWFLVDHPPVAQCVLDYVSKRVLNRVLVHHPEYARVHQLLIAATFARILPYVKSEEHLQTVQQRLRFFAEGGMANAITS